MHVFDDEGIVKYPYFFVGVDTLIDGSYISSYNLSSKTEGYIGSIRWKPNSLPLEEYDASIQAMIKESTAKYDDLLKAWSYQYNNGNAKKLYQIEIPGLHAVYGYDAIYTLIYAIK